MFSFLKRFDDGTYIDLIEAICEDLDNIELSKLAIHKAVNMIGNAISKSNFEVREKGNVLRNELSYRLNIRPNDNESGTYFWNNVVYKIVTERKCMIIVYKKKFYIVDDYTESDTFRERIYKNIRIIQNGKRFNIDKEFKSSDVIFIQMGDISGKNIAKLLQKITKKYDETLSKINKAIAICGFPKFKMAMAAQGKFVTVDSEGNQKTISRDQFLNNTKKLLSGEGIQIFPATNGLDLTQIKIDTSFTPDHMRKIRDEINEITSYCLDIPITIFNGNVTEKSDATNEFITFAVSPYVESINDAMNHALVGRESWEAGEEIKISLRQFKHIDVIESAANLSALRGIGFNFDEIREMTGYSTLDTEFSQSRALTKNYMSEIDQSGSGGKEETNEGNVSV